MNRREFLVASTATMIHPTIDDFLRRRHNASEREEQAVSTAFDKATEEERLARAVNALKDADVAVLFAGDDLDRVPFFHKAYERVMDRRSEPLRVICTGGHAGFVDSRPSQAYVMAEALHRGGIPNDLLTMEPHSRDTIANAIYTSQLLTPSERVVAAVTSGSHRARVNAFMQRTLDRSKTVRSVGTSKTGDFAKELAKTMTVAWDTDTITRGDLPAWSEYLREDHPFHAPYHGNKPSGIYTAAVRFDERRQGRDFDATVERIIGENKR